MKKIKLGRHEVEIFDDIETLPMYRFHKYNKMLLLDAGIGSDLSAIDVHISKAIAFLGNEPEMARKELMNLRKNISLIHEGISPKHLAFACIVKSIDGNECNDMSDDGLQRVVEMLGGAPYREVEMQSDRAKKKIDSELQIYFPAIFDDARSKEFYDQAKRRTIAILDGIIDGDNKAEEVENITMSMLRMNKPHSFDGEDNAEVRHDKSYERMNVIIEEQLHTNPKKKSVMEYYQAFEYLQEREKNERKARKGRF